jgi:hypothetical protein
MKTQIMVGTVVTEGSACLDFVVRFEVITLLMRCVIQQQGFIVKSFLRDKTYKRCFQRFVHIYPQI